MLKEKAAGLRDVLKEKAGAAFDKLKEVDGREDVQEKIEDLRNAKEDTQENESVQPENVILNQTQDLERERKQERVKNGE